MVILKDSCRTNGYLERFWKKILQDDVSFRKILPESCKILRDNHWKSTGESPVNNYEQQNLSNFNRRFLQLVYRFITIKDLFRRILRLSYNNLLRSLRSQKKPGLELSESSVTTINER